MTHPWTNVYGVARTILACGLLTTLLIDGVDVLFQPDAFRALHQAAPVNRISLFYLMAGAPGGLQAARWIAIAVLLLVASGWRPRFTGLPHWWVAFSFAASTSVAEGGDQIHAILALLLVPVTLLDPRPSVWRTWTPDLARVREQARAVAAASCFTVIALQVAVIYFQAGVSKMSVGEWANGTAVWYWFTHPVYGMSGAVKELAVRVMMIPAAVTALTWGVIVLEVLLATGLVMDRRHRPLLLKAGLLFHFGIVVAHGLLSFFFAMAGALILYLRPFDEPFSLQPLAAGARRLQAAAAAARGALPHRAPARPGVAT
ncbi:MAG TPA: sporulation-delaying protein SdpB family protein [Longimicrobium sp.]